MFYLGATSQRMTLPMLRRLVDIGSSFSDYGQEQT
jgi:hypothetical protein